MVFQAGPGAQAASEFLNALLWNVLEHKNSYLLTSSSEHFQWPNSLLWVNQGERAGEESFFSIPKMEQKSISKVQLNTR